MTEPKFNENTGMRIMPEAYRDPQPGETTTSLDPDRVVDVDASVEYKDTPRQGNELGGIDAILSINGTPRWTKKIRLLMKRKPDNMSLSQWQEIVDMVVVQSEEIVQNED